MEIGIIGSGNIGSTLAGYLTALGHQVMIANSRGPKSLGDIAAKTGATAVTTEAAAGAEDLIIIAIPNKAIVNLPKEILSASKATIVDAGNYYPSRDGQIDDIQGGLTDSEWVAK
ncbi:NAD(P)-binding domain-containing protein [Dyadobacter psychrophilus]|uniref:NADP oxidoreductase coenzyme F420-dependent n=1 Tax=Dyadobacter psychrophilus TaxID=651661 RepID=A0A1T5DYY6_9BACT|nr:NAD(P)-binding domain-containing protein [Dyadobacter psychrophilus]SKB76834.1 NADP oxidoreductase coenzyme F420-dependent [Dyadobacter psychrophilus]